MSNTNTRSPLANETDKPITPTHASRIDEIERLRRQMEQPDLPEEQPEGPSESTSDADDPIMEQLRNILRVQADSRDRSTQVEPITAPIPEQSIEAATEPDKPSLCETTEADAEEVMRKETTSPPISDAELNGVPVAELLGNEALFRGLDPETTRQVREIRERTSPQPIESAPDREAVSSSEDAPLTPVPTSAPVEAPGSEAGASPAATSHPAPDQSHAPRDPLQIGLDRPMPIGAADKSALPPHASIEHTHRPTSPRRAFKVKSAAPAETSESPLRDNMTESSPTEQEKDAELFMDLGYEGELRRTPEGAIRADEVQRDRLRNERIGTRNMVPAAYRGEEYTGSEMTGQVERGFRSALRGSVLRTAIAAICCIVGILYDLLPLMDGTGFASSIAYPLSGLLLLLLAAAPSLRRLGLGLRSLWDLEPVRYAVPGMALSMTVLHTLLSCLATENGKTATLFCGASLLILTVTCLCDLLSILSQARAFRILSSGRARTIITILSAPGARSSSDDLTDAWEQSSAVRPGEKALRVCRTSGVPNFFALVNRYQDRMTHLNYLLPSALLLAIAAAGVSLLDDGKLLSDALPRFTATYLACMPLSLLLALILPYHIAERHLSEHGCAILGEAEPERYTRPAKRRAKTCLLLPDGLLLRPIRPNEITVHGDPGQEEYVRVAHALFALLDHPLAGVGRPPRREELEPLRIELAERSQHYLRLYLTDSQTGESIEVQMGSYDALTVRHIRLPDRALEETYKKTAEAAVLYLAFDRRFRFACACAWEIEPCFQHFETQLVRTGHRIAVLTYDPLAEVTPLFVPDRQVAPEIFRPNAYSQLYAPRSGSLVSVHDGTEVLEAYIACRRIRKANAIGLLLGWIWLVVAGGLAVASPLLGLSVASLPWVCCLGQLVATGLSALPALFLTRQHRKTISQKRS